MKVEVTSKQLSDEANATRRVFAVAADQSHTSAHLISDGLTRVAFGLVILAIAVVGTVLVGGDGERHQA